MINQSALRAALASAAAEERPTTEQVEAVAEILSCGRNFTNYPIATIRLHDGLTDGRVSSVARQAIRKARSLGVDEAVSAVVDLAEVERVLFKTYAFVENIVVDAPLRISEELILLPEFSVPEPDVHRGDGQGSRAA